MKKRTLCLFLSLLLVAACLLPACGNDVAVEPTEEKTVKKDPVRDPAEDGKLNILMVGTPVPCPA